MREEEIKRIRENLHLRERIVIKVGSSSITHAQTGALNFRKLEVLVREICDLKNQGKDMILVSSGAIAVGRRTVHMKEKPSTLSAKQACAAIGQAELMMTYQKLFAEYGHVAAQILLTKDTTDDRHGSMNAVNTFDELLSMDVIPVVNENDTISTYEIQYGDNDTLSAVVAGLTGADLLILLSDIDGLYTDDPRKNPAASFVPFVDKLNDRMMAMGKGAGSESGTGGMATKLHAASIAGESGCDMIIANGSDFHVIHKLIEGQDIGTLFLAKRN